MRTPCKGWRGSDFGVSRFERFCEIWIISSKLSLGYLTIHGLHTACIYCVLLLYHSFCWTWEPVDFLNIHYRSPGLWGRWTSEIHEAISNSCMWKRKSATIWWGSSQQLYYYIHIYIYLCVCSIYTYAALLQVNRVFASSTDANRTRFRDQGQETQDLPVGELYCTNSGVGNQSQYGRVFRDEKNHKETWGCVQLVSANMSYVFTIYCTFGIASGRIDHSTCS